MSIYKGTQLISGVVTPVQGARNIGQIIQSTIPLTDAGLHLLDGALIQGSGIYSAFVTYIAGLVSTYPDLFETEANWQSAVTAYGVCGKFVYDSVNNTVRLPKYSNKIYTKDITSIAPVKGDGKSLGFTNGANTAGLANVSSQGVLGAMINAYDANLGTPNTGSAITVSYNIGVTLDGTKSGIIADLANITTSLEGYYYIVIATSTKTDIEVDIDEIATDLNGKADVDLTNVNTTGMSKSAGWVMPSTTYNNVTVGASGATYTAPANGWFVAYNANGNSGGVVLLNTNSYLRITASPQSGFSDGSAFIPCKKGDVVRLNYTGTFGSQYGWFRFVYAVGSESEA